MAGQRRVVVTGVGLITPLGLDARSTWRALIGGESGIGTISFFDTSRFSVSIAGEVKSFDPLAWVAKKDVKKMDRFIQFAIAAADQAIKDAALQVTPENAERTGVYISSGIGGFGTIEKELQVLMTQGPRRISPFFIPAVIVNLAAGWVSIRSGAKGPNSSTCTACTSSAHAVGDSFRLIQRGDADVMIAGGSEAAITQLAVAGFAAMRALSTRNDDPQRASRPFDLDRDGFVIGEGSGILILEELECARRRGARIYCEIVGYGMSGDAFHVSAPSEDGDGARRVMSLAIRDAGITPADIEYVNTHGTATPPGDRAEVVAIKRVFGDHAYKLAVNSTKSMTGHLLGAAGALEAGITSLVIHEGVMPPTINQEKPDPDCDLDFIPNQSRPARVRYALSNSFGFGGTNAATVFKRYEE
ncbi:MAG: beta-ketoacyl-ACP synthase II [Vicinamibacteria bacterium]|nr:beta-ketoacyl-ACP synthase II [Vicinamibacteria bacterium]